MIYFFLFNIRQTFALTDKKDIDLKEEKKPTFLQSFKQGKKDMNEKSNSSFICSCGTVCLDQHDLDIHKV